MTPFNKWFILGISLVSAMGGFLFGYDWVVIGGAKPFYERFFDIAGIPSLQAWAMSSALIGCIIGAVSSAFIADRFGRKRPMLLSSVLFTVSAIGTGLTSHFDGFILFRILGGMGIGLTSALSPMYIAEIAPARMRGGYVSLNQLTIVIGILAAQIINLLIAKEVPVGASDEYIRESWNGQFGWRWMFLVEAFPAALFMLLLFFIPESPRWLIKTGQAEKAFPTLCKIGGRAYAEEQMQQIAATVQQHRPTTDFKAAFSPLYGKVLLLGVFLAVFQQWSGINTVFNYADEIFSAAGYGVSDTLFNIVITGSVNLVFTVLAIFTVDRWGRKKLMLFGAVGLAVTYILLGSVFYLQMKGVAVLALVVVAIAVYAMSLAPITWVVLSEIFPNSIRGTAMSIATFALWTACFVLTYTFPLLNNALGAAGTFWIYAGICVLGFWFIIKQLPETKGKSLEEIENVLVNKRPSESKV